MKQSIGVLTLRIVAHLMKIGKDVKNVWNVWNAEEGDQQLVKIAMEGERRIIIDEKAGHEDKAKTVL